MEITLLDSVVSATALAVAATLYVRLSQKERNSLGLPPGPSTVPVLGNIKLPEQPLAKSYRAIGDQIGKHGSFAESIRSHDVGV